MLLFALLLLPVAIWLTGHLTAGTRTSRAQPLARLTRPTSWNPLEGRHVRLPPALPPASPRAAPVAPGGRGPPALRQLRVVVSEKEQCNCIAVCQAEPLARRSLLPGLPAPAAAGGIGDSNGDPCPDAGDRVANIIIIVVVITAITSPIIFQGSSDLLRAPPKPLLRGVSGAPRAMAHAEAEVQDNLEAVVGLIGSSGEIVVDVAPRVTADLNNPEREEQMRALTRWWIKRRHGECANCHRARGSPGSRATGGDGRCRWCGGHVCSEDCFREHDARCEERPPRDGRGGPWRGRSVAGKEPQDILCRMCRHRVEPRPCSQPPSVGMRCVATRAPHQSGAVNASLAGNVLAQTGSVRRAPSAQLGRCTTTVCGTTSPRTILDTLYQMALPS